MLNTIVSAMEAPILSAQHFAVIVPVAIVVILAVLVFAFGFQKTVEPPSFKQLNYSSDDKKTKKKKIKDKKPQTNGHAVVIDVSDSKKSETPKIAKSTKVETPKQKKIVDSDKDKKNEAQKSPGKKEKKDNVEVKNKKNAQKVENQKPVDFDDGEWETAPSRKDKKKKKDDQEIVATYSPEKAGKKSPAINKVIAKKIDTVLEAKPIEILKIEDVLAMNKQEAAQPEVIKPAPTEPAVAPIADPAPAPAPVAAEEPAKKKKAKKTKTSASEEDVAVADGAGPAEPVVAAAESQAQVFNELEDAWQDAPQKKTKKKARKD